MRPPSSASMRNRTPAACGSPCRCRRSRRRRSIRCGSPTPVTAPIPGPRSTSRSAWLRCRRGVRHDRGLAAVDGPARERAGRPQVFRPGGERRRPRCARRQPRRVLRARRRDAGGDDAGARLAAGQCDDRRQRRLHRQADLRRRWRSPARRADRASAARRSSAPPAATAASPSRCRGGGSRQLPDHAPRLPATTSTCRPRRPRRR